MTAALPRSRADLLLSLRKTELTEEVAQRLAAQARPALVLMPEPASTEELPLGSTKFGGRPDLPSGTSWPVRPPYADGTARAAQYREDAGRLRAQAAQPGSWMTPEQAESFAAEHEARARAVETEAPLAFIAQVDLTTLQGKPGFDPLLPASGRLLLFFDLAELPAGFEPGSRAGWRLLWDDGAADDLVRLPAPEGLGEVCCSARAIKAASVLTPIPLSDAGWDAFPLTDGDALSAYQEWLDAFGTPDGSDADRYQLGGFPRPLQNSMQVQSQLAFHGIACGSSDALRSEAAQALLPGARSWRLLLQLGGNDPIGTMTGPGALYLLIREGDLQERAFEHAWVVFQCD